MDTSNWLEIVLMIVTALITSFLIPYIRSKTTAQEREKILSLVKIACSSAEQMAELVTGKDKYAYVENLLMNMGIKISADELEAMIEACVFEINKEFTKEEIQAYPEGE